MATALLTNSGDVTTMERRPWLGRSRRPVLRGDGTDTATLTVNNSGEIVTSGDARTASTSGPRPLTMAGLS